MNGQSRTPGGRFVKGQSGNPGGRPKGLFSFTKEIRRYLNEEAVDENGQKVGKKNGRLFIENVIERAAEGNSSALNQVLDRLEGPVPKAINVSSLSTEQLIAILAESGFEDDEGGADPAGR